MISFSNINKQYGKQLLFVDASFQLNPGEKVGLVGPNGVGKTTLFRMVVGEETPDEGTGGPDFDRADITKIVGAPSLRFVQGRVRCCQYRGGYRAQRSASHLQYASSALYQFNERRTKITFRDRGRVKSLTACVRCTRPCTERKSGAPTMLLMPVKPKAGPPAPWLPRWTKLAFWFGFFHFFPPLNLIGHNSGQGCRIGFRLLLQSFRPCQTVQS